jgi:hypothetical protein
VFSRLSGEETLRLVTMALALSILLVSILHVDLLVHQELFVHAFDSFIRGLE